MKRLLYITFLICSIFMISCSPDNSSACPDSNCSDYLTQEEAQQDFNSDPECRNDLDHDNDRIACEHLPSRRSICPTTTNCGCSNKRKSECGGPCCAWTIGSGCNCS